MKIISSFKDYYDFVGGYDADPRKVFVRNGIKLEKKQVPLTKFIDNKLKTNKKAVELQKQYDIEWNKLNSNHPIFKTIKEYSSLIPEINSYIGSVWFCNQFYTFLHNNKNEFYYEYEQIPINLIKEINKIIITKWHHSLDYYFRKQKEGWSWLRTKNLDELKKEQNTLYGQPIVYSCNEGIIINGELNKIGFNKVKSPSQAFTEIYNFIPYIEPEMPSDPVDMCRFENKGFDSKTSFRHPIK